MSNKTRYEWEIKEAIIREIEKGNYQIDQIWSKLKGADPRIVNAIFKTIDEITCSEDDIAKIEKRKAEAKRLAKDLLGYLPAPDKIRSQWWFTVESLPILSKLTRYFTSKNPIAFIGTPTLAHYYHYRYRNQ